jgi:hypothetical protein
MASLQTTSVDETESSDVEFFGVKLRVRNPHLAALLNSSVNEDVQVIGRRARDAFGPADDSRAELEIARRLRDAGDSVKLRVDEPVGD